MERCGHVIMVKVTLLNQILGSRLKHILNSNCSIDGSSHTGVLSSMATLHGDVIFCDTLVKLCFEIEQGVSNSFQISTFQIWECLASPYWFSFPLEKVFQG
ncbi:hypothetical protein Scep_018404 [Stephania cephalantha]|uniref:Uncharacterized protein n=1 Tax=Stephania cephalantha TaxID=152367 RepID=A0AAP0I911_9MAGN